jgi:hypothetical protein
VNSADAQETISHDPQFEDAAQTSSAKWLAELDARADDTAHDLRSLFKTAIGGKRGRRLDSGM